ncbi:hypothetical protein G9A89_003932 [Geosiphon pyriformis]|nr:hypothetical protein G9A89_003932 [Geosiphon pyriformis]
MESLPREFILHNVPLMAVIGLGLGNDSEPTSPTSPTSPASRRSSVSTGSPPISTRQQLSKSLLTLLTAKNQGGIWETGKASGSIFRVVAVEKNHEFLPRKSNSRIPSSTSHSIMPVPHSPLSPLTPGSPLYPDGLISPIWVRKHRENVPALVVGFYDLWDWSTMIGGADSDGTIKAETNIVATTAHEPLGTTENFEKERDAQLAAEISERRRTIYDRGIRFAAVVILKQQHIDDPTIEERLGSIRRGCGLEQKNSFFVLPPTAQSELQNFTTNLQKSLYEVTLGYYREHGKRVKKKRSRLPSPASIGYVPHSADQSRNTPLPLGVQGWMIRYDYKMAAFAEFRQEMDTALRYYESAYNLLLDMFAPTSTITPGAPGFPIRTKRWAEAKVLADCINLKICKLNLYLDAPSAAMTQLNRHIVTFRKLSNIWGIGEETFEYWAWFSKQYHIFGDLLDIATRFGFKIPTFSSSSTSSDYRHITGYGPMGLNPKMMLQHAGFYYHFAATCTSERRKRYLTIQKVNSSEIQKHISILKNIDTSKLPPAPILTAEGNIDHSKLTIELLTKSYEQFKKYKSGRMTLYLASEIAGTYFEAGKYEMALKFFERIAKTYRKEHWDAVLESILRLSLRCAKELEAWENVVEYLVELMSNNVSSTNEKRIEVQNHLMDILYENDVINSITITTPTHSPAIPLRFDILRLSFNDAYFNYCVTDNGNSGGQNQKLKWVDLRDCQLKEIEGVGFFWTKMVNLNITKGSTLVYEGMIIPKESGELTLLSISLGLLSPYWKVDLNFNIAPDQSAKKVRRKWLEFGDIIDGTNAVLPKFITLEGRGDQTSIKVTQKSAKVEIQVNHHSPALLDEHYQIELVILNLESEDVKVILNAELVSLDFEVLDAYVTSDPAVIGRQSLNEIDVGIVPAGESSIQKIYVFGEKFPIPRTLHISVWYASATSIPPTPPPTSGWIEKEEELRIPFILPFEVSFSSFPQYQGVSFYKLPDGESYGKLEKQLLVAKIISTGPWDIRVSGIDLILPDISDSNVKLEIKGFSTDLEDTFQQQVWRPGNVYQVNYLLELTIMDPLSFAIPIKSGSLVLIWSRLTKSNDDEIVNKTTIQGPSLEANKIPLSAIISIPSAPVVGQLFTLIYTIMNSTNMTSEIHVYVEVHEAFVFAGYKQTLFRVLPLSTYLFKVNCFPLAAGKVRLPKVRFVIKANSPGVDHSTDRELKVLMPGVKENLEDDEIMVFIKPKQDI